MKKYNFIEFIAATESRDFDKIDEKCLTWAKKLYDHYKLDNIEKMIHIGDCTKHSHPCDLCLLEYFLKEYKEYSLNEGNWREDNGL